MVVLITYGGKSATAIDDHNYAVVLLSDNSALDVEDAALL